MLSFINYGIIYFINNPYLKSLDHLLYLRLFRLGRNLNLILLKQFRCLRLEHIFPLIVPKNQYFQTYCPYIKWLILKQIFCFLNLWLSTLVSKFYLLYDSAYLLYHLFHLLCNGLLNPSGSFSLLLRQFN